MFGKSKAELYISLLRGLPPPVSYRIDHKVSSRVFRRGSHWRLRTLFGDFFFDALVADAVQRSFSLHWSNAYYLMVLASKIVRKGDVVFEIGANVGTETLWFSALVGQQGRVIAVEPYPPNAAVLRQQVAANSIKNITIIESAITEQQSVVSFRPAQAVNSGTGHIGGDSSGDATEIQVSTVSLDSLLTFGHPRLVFMDIEGAEANALQGATRVLERSRPFFVLEVNSALLQRAGRSVDELKDVFRRNEYACFDVGAGLAPVSQQAETPSASDWLAIPQEQIMPIGVLKATLTLSKILPPVMWRGWKQRIEE